MNKNLIGNILALVIIIAVVIVFATWLPRVTLVIVTLLQLTTFIVLFAREINKRQQKENEEEKE